MKKLKNEVTIKATIEIMKEVLDEEEISYNCNITREQLIQIVRDNFLV